MSFLVLVPSSFAVNVTTHHVLCVDVFAEDEHACIALVVGVRRRGKGERRASEAREDRTREDRDPPALILAFLPPFLRPATQANACKATCTVHVSKSASQDWLFLDFPGISEK